MKSGPSRHFARGWPTYRPAVTWTKVRLFYLPGNHDRLVNRYASLRQKACTCLGIPPGWHDPQDPFPSTYEDLAVWGLCPARA